MADTVLQYLRKCTLIISSQNVGSIDLSNLRIKFSVKRSDTPTPNTADIRVYNLEEQTALLIKKEFTKVLLQGGYDSNYGVIFQGNITQVVIGRESGTDTFIDIIAGDGDKAYNFAVVSKTLDAGSTQKNQIEASIESMTAAGGVSAGFIGATNLSKLPRGKVMYGNARNYLRYAAQTLGASWSIQDEKVNFVPLTAYLPGEQVVLSSTTGMIGTPYQTNEGVNVKCLLNPRIAISGRVLINNATILEQKLNLDQIAAAGIDNKAVNNLLPKRLNADGSYYVLVLEHQGDTRGIEWYTSMVCLNIDVSANPLNSVTGANG